MEVCFIFLKKKKQNSSKEKKIIIIKTIKKQRKGLREFVYSTSSGDSCQVRAKVGWTYRLCGNGMKSSSLSVYGHMILIISGWLCCTMLCVLRFWGLAGNGQRVTSVTDNY